jgi:phosphoribosylformylglycinamidine synthase
MSGSAYERLAGAAPEDRPPSLDLGKEAALQKLLQRAAQDKLLNSAQDVSGGGLAVALAECAIWGGLGADLTLAVAQAPAVALFGESPSRAVVTVSPERWNELARLAGGMRVACRRLGTVGGDRLRIRLSGVGATGAAEERGAGVADEVDVSLNDLAKAWTHALPRALGEEWVA